MKTSDNKMGSHSTAQKSGCNSATGCSTDKTKAKAGTTKSAPKSEHKKVGK